MELSWTTFLLEAANFLVLVWLLKRLFYAPVKRAIAARRAAVEKTLQDAETEKREAGDLKAKYEGRLQEWEQEKEQEREEFRKELGEERAKQLKVIEDAVKTEREKAEALEQKQSAERLANQERQAIQHALEFTSRMLGGLASPELEGRLVDLTARQIASSSLKLLPNGHGSPAGQSYAVTVQSAYPLSGQQRTTLSAALRQLLKTDLPVTFDTNPKLLAGLEIAIGSYVLRANLRDELEYFSVVGNHEHV